MNLVNPEHFRDEGRKPLKKSMTGMEVELHLIDDKGKISYQAPQIIEELQKAGNVHITKEIGSNMMEFGCLPDVKTYNPALNMISSIQEVSEFCAKQNLSFYPFATYPGKFKSQFTPGGKYEVLKKIFGKEQTENVCRITGFHHHYAFPKGVFDNEKKDLKLLRKSKLARTLISSYNFEIAADPVLTLLTQSSPFFQGVNLAKDSRMLIYRGGKKLHYMQGFYANHQQLGGLPPYKQTLMDLSSSLHKREERWKKEFKSVDPKGEFENPYSHYLDITRNPVKLNKHGTFEQRGMDTNFLSILVGVTVLLKFCLREIQRKFYVVVPEDFAIDEAFKVESGILYVPPHTYLRNKLQSASAYGGYANDVIYNYTKRFFHFAQSVTPKRYNNILKPVKEMIEHKMSMSDQILKYARWKGFVDENGNINDEDAAELALHYSGQISKDLEDTRKKLEKLSGV
ncbi:MAG: hypothetical protein ABIH82_00090 [Candidatus Woesearchaeota archaeon]